MRQFPYVIVATTAWDYDKLQAHRHHIGDAAYHVSQMKGDVVLEALEGYIRELGYTALRGVVNPQAAGPRRRRRRAGPQRADHHREVRRPRPHARPDS